MSNTLKVKKAELRAIMHKVAEFVEQATPLIEKQAATEVELNEFAEKAAQSLANAGLVSQDSVEAIQKDLAKGGFDKISEAFDFVLEKLNEKQASFSYGRSSDEDTNKANPTADEVWEQKLQLR